MLTRRLFMMGASAILSLPVGNALAQSATWPARPIHVVVTQPPGGGNDAIARLIAAKLQPVFGQPAIVENKPGAGGNIATVYVAKQPADGYTLLLTPSSHVGNVYFFARLPYDPIKDFEPISLVSSTPFIFVVNASMPVTSMKEFLSYARAHPGLTYGSAGIGQPHHTAAELLKSMTGIDIVHVPYKGAAGVVPALLSGEISFTIGAINSLLPHIRSGKLRVLAAAGSTRTALLPDVPTIAEAADLPGYEMTSWAGILAPAGTPRAIVDRLSTEINRAVRDPEVREKLAAGGIEPIGTTPERFMEIMKAQLVQYGKITKEANIKPE
jgi:tripartite-type tricarboxylate transporter receptor subunit TctC